MNVTKGFQTPQKNVLMVHDSWLRGHDYAIPFAIGYIVFITLLLAQVLPVSNG